MAGSAKFRASSMADLDRLVAFVARACARAGADADSRFAVRLAVEEAFTNVMRHGYGAGSGPVTVSVQHAGNRISVIIRDRGPPFDPTAAPAPDVGTDWQQRDPGGLGLHLLRKMMDGVRYRRDTGGENVLTLIKKLPGLATGS